MPASTEARAPFWERRNSPGWRNAPYLVNTARASAIDHEALLAALEAGAGSPLRISMSIRTNPSRPADPLLAMGKDRLLLTPHAAGVSHDIPANTARLLADGLLRLLRGEVPDSRRQFADPSRPAFQRLGLETSRENAGGVDT